MSQLIRVPTAPFASRRACSARRCRVSRERVSFWGFLSFFIMILSFWWAEVSLALPTATWSATAGPPWKKRPPKEKRLGLYGTASKRLDS